MSSDDITLLQLMRGRFSAAKRFRCLAIASYVVAALLGLISTLWAQTLFTKITPFAMAFFQGLVFLFENHTQIKRSHAETLKRMIMLEDGLGWSISSKEEADTRAEASWTALRFAKQANTSPYYTSSEPQGPKRLLDNVQESIFFTRYISSAASNWLWFITTVVFLVGIGALISAILAVPQQNVQVAIAKGAISTLLVVAAGLSLQEALTYGRLAKRCEILDERAESMRREQLSIEVVLKLICDYECALLSAPLLPEIIYNRKKNRLNTLWEGRIAGQNDLFPEEQTGSTG